MLLLAAVSLILAQDSQNLREQGITGEEKKNRGDGQERVNDGILSLSLSFSSQFYLLASFCSCLRFPDVLTLSFFCEVISGARRRSVQLKLGIFSIIAAAGENVFVLFNVLLCDDNQ